MDYLTIHTSISPIRRRFAPGFVNYKKRCTRLTAASDKAYQLLAHGRWFSPGTPASSTTKTGRHVIAEVLLKVALNTKYKNKITEYALIKVIQEMRRVTLIIYLCFLLLFFATHIVYDVMIKYNLVFNNVSTMSCNGHKLER